MSDTEVVGLQARQENYCSIDCTDCQIRVNASLALVNLVASAILCYDDMHMQAAGYRAKV
jgi:hypothetical protein